MELYNAENKTDYTIETFHSDETLYEKYNAFEHAYTCAYLQYNMTPGNKIGIIADPLALLKELTTYHLEGLAKAYEGPNEWKHNADLNRDLWNNKQGVMEAYNSKKSGKSFEDVVTSIYEDIAHSNPDDFNESVGWVLTQQKNLLSRGNPKNMSLREALPRDDDFLFQCHCEKIVRKTYE